jgi:hypothetical protein
VLMAAPSSTALCYCLKLSDGLISGQSKNLWLWRTNMRIPWWMRCIHLLPQVGENV